MKQTAVEWLEDNLIFVAWAEEHFTHNKKCLEQAKEMEKEQIEKSYDLGYSMCKINLEGLTFKSE